MHMCLFNLLQLNVTFRVETSPLIWNQKAGFYALSGWNRLT